MNSMNMRELESEGAARGVGSEAQGARDEEHAASQPARASSATESSLLQGLNAVIQHRVITCHQDMGIAISGINLNRLFSHPNGTFISGSCLIASCRSPVISPCQVAAGNIVVTVRGAGVFKSRNRFLKTVKIEQGDSEI